MYFYRMVLLYRREGRKAGKGLFLMVLRNVINVFELSDYGTNI